jgi:AMP-binding enzyme C-terminal domain
MWQITWMARRGAVCRSMVSIRRSSCDSTSGVETGLTDTANDSSGSEQLKTGSPGVLDASTGIAGAVVAVFGVPDDKWGEAIGAVVVPPGSVVVPFDLQEHVRSRQNRLSRTDGGLSRSACSARRSGTLIRVAAAAPGPKTARIQADFPVAGVD